MWLALNNLLVDPACRARYAPQLAGDGFRRDALLRLRPRLGNELLQDQLPVLRDLARVLDELALGVGDGAASSSSSRLILEQVKTLGVTGVMLWVEGLGSWVWEFSRHRM